MMPPFLSGAVALGIIIVVVVIVSRYRRERRDAIAGLVAGSQVAETPGGPIEYAIRGEGPALLVLHGGGGGYDQGLLMAHFIKRHRFKIITVSRPGYLRTPLDVGRSPEAQADAYAALLDTLKISRVAVLAASAGGMSALQFALRHPERCWALVMVSAISQPLVLDSRMVALVNVMLRSDFIPWLMIRLAARQAMAANGRLEAEVLEDERKMAVLRELLEEGITSSLRREGFANDYEQNMALSAYSLEAIAAPTLVIHGTDDPIVPFSQGQFTAETVSGATLVTIQGGGHWCLWTHEEKTTPALTEFMTAYAPNGMTG